MRYFEIRVSLLNEDTGDTLNNNMRCFEIKHSPLHYPSTKELNNNMRCFEISFNHDGYNLVMR